MIQSAHVGIGMSGQEGSQATLSSDYVVHRFKHLERLLLIHGRYNYYRIAKLILYCFYKNILLYLSQYWFNLVNGFSGQSLYEKWTLAFFNILFTLVPVLILGIFDRDVKESYVLAFPKLYTSGPRGKPFNLKVFIVWISNAIYHSLLLVFLPFSLQLVDDTALGSSGRTYGLYTTGVMIYICIMVVLTLKLILETNRWTILHIFFYFGSLLLFFVYLLTFNTLVYPTIVFCSQYVPYLPDIAAETNGVSLVILTSPRLLLTLVLVIIITFAKDFLWKAIRRWFTPKPYVVVQEIQAVRRRNRRVQKYAKYIPFLSPSWKNQLRYDDESIQMLGSLSSGSE